MARCKDCFHFDVCMDYTSLKDSDFAQNFNETDILCDHFKRAADVAAVRHGKWLKTDAYPHKVYCSLCYKTYVTNEEIIAGMSWSYPSYCTEAEYCPHCGARMDGKGESDA